MEDMIASHLGNNYNSLKSVPNILDQVKVLAVGNVTAHYFELDEN